MDSSTPPSCQNQNSQPNSELLRFLSAPNSLLATFSESLDTGLSKGGPHSDRLTYRFMNPSQDKSGTEATIDHANSRRTFPGLPPHYPRQTSSAMDTSYLLLGMDPRCGKPVTSSLLRQSSSPPGLFTNLFVQTGEIAGLGSYTNGELSPSSSSNRLKNQISFSSRLPSSLGILSQISEVVDDAKLETGCQYGSWNDSANFPENFSGSKTTQDNDPNFFSANQNSDSGSRFHVLSHHLSLPKTSNETPAMEKFLSFQDPVPCKIRAKRGCATHPRSIAERVRRTRISERMRKLQELVPNMDKQTNTADMLDLAVDYIKDLQKQFKTLNDRRANCKCLNIQKPIPNQVL
ncbi:Transcription factor protein [Gossypium arboreum]|uniref:Uncharacterized protein n=2 Tax=Gossypium arboreum TaxID=29729 RepID=A0ABR0NTS0_GOSAR|nr:transcription factor bHLH130-like isoform X1 [Gossypium arboreum]KAK5803904.1 hypothetical protein PVK06_031553 [Gossypium arboreum]KHG25713.1 Transcription factor protein [Gossypium arboreum]